MRRLVKRDIYLDRIARLRDTPNVKVLQGMRRCGKSSVLALYVDVLLGDGVPAENVFVRRFDSFGLPLVQTADALAAELAAFFDSCSPGHPAYVFLDEVQEVEGWERVVRGLRERDGTDVYVTGSNAHLLSSDLATLLAGRATPMRVQPLSFGEYLVFRDAFGAAGDAPGQEPQALFAEYLRLGGMPGLFELRERDEQAVAAELGFVYDSVIVNDVLGHMEVRDPTLLRRLSRYLISTSGSLFSTNAIANYLRSAGRRVSPETVDAYVDGLCKAYVLVEVEQEGLAGKRVLNPLRKFYAADCGLRGMACRFSGADLGFQLEGVVANELLLRGFGLTVGSLPRGEVDFVARRGAERTYVQVSESLVDPRTYERELAPLRAIGDSHPKLVLTLDRFRNGVTEDGIRVECILDWLLA